MSFFIAQFKCSAPPVSKTDRNHITFLSSWDPLLSPIMSTNFKCFDSIIGPVFWIQDRVEEIIVWKTHPIRPLIWMAASFICASCFVLFLFFCLTVTRFSPRIFLLMLHVILIALATAHVSGSKFNGPCRPYLCCSVHSGASTCDGVLSRGKLIFEEFKI